MYTQEVAAASQSAAVVLGAVTPEGGGSDGSLGHYAHC